MKELRHKQEVRRRLYSLPVLIGLLLVTILIGRGTWNIAQKYRESARLVTDLRAQEVELTTKQASLKADIAKLNTDEGLDAEIKDKFNVVKPGEQVAVIVDATKPATSTATSTPSWWKRLWSSIIGH